MFFSSQFDRFNPLFGAVTDRPLACLPEIAQRARRLLKSRSTEQVVAAAKKISEAIDDYFRDARATEIYRLESELHPDDEEFNSFFEWDGGTQYNGRWFFKDSMADVLGIPTEENTNEVDALKAVVENRDGYVFFGDVDQEPVECPEGRDYELFAVVSLWLLADSLSFQERTTRDGLSIASNLAVTAMDAVCYAEHLRDVEWLVSNIKEKSRIELLDALHKQKIEHAKLVRDTLELSEERIRKTKREQALLLNKARHQKNYDAMALVLEDWGKDPTKFLSAEKAGNYYADWLEQKGVRYTIKGKLSAYQPRTVTGWIRAHARKIDIKFR